MTRARLPDRRAGETFGFEHEGQAYIATVGCYDDGRIGEVFLTLARKGGAAAAAVAHDAAVAASLALQHGVAIDTLVGAMLHHEDGTPAGPLGHALRLAGDGAVVAEADSPCPPPAGQPGGVPASEGAAASATALAPAGGSSPCPPPTDQPGGVYADESCRECGNQTLVRAGTCLTCHTCGTTTGCS